ncbi:MAG: amino acid ABC transporter permease [Clostridia bacterium]|nr:amino acid ABC transporter permease [Clostridia bacterium]
MTNWFDVWQRLPQFFDGLAVTLQVSLLALVLAMVIGVVVAILRVVDNPAANFIGKWYVEFFQNTPLVIQVFFFYQGLPTLGVSLSEFTCGTLGLGIYTGAYIAEVFRAGIQSVAKGQWEAARSQGFTYLQTMNHIILPQALRVSLPPLGNQVVNLVKNSAILSTIAVADLMYEANLVMSETFIVFEVYIFAAVLYLALTIPLSALVEYLERRVAQGYQ